MKKITRLGVSTLVTVLVLSAFAGSVNVNTASAQNSPNQPGTNMPNWDGTGSRGLNNTGGTTSPRINIKNVLKLEATTTKDRMEAEKELRAKVKDALGQFLANFTMHVTKVTEKLQAVYDRLTNIADRIDSRIAKLSAQKVDVSVSTKFVASARQELKLAKMSIEAISADFKIEMNTATSVSATTSATSTNISATTNTTESAKIGGRNFRTIFTKTFANITAAKDHLRKAHTYLVQAIENLKPGFNDMGEQGGDHSTTSASTTTKIKKN